MYILQEELITSWVGQYCALGGESKIETVPQALLESLFTD
jgi:hypothetical protein